MTATSGTPSPKSVQCLHCGAKPGEPCRDFLGGTTRRTHAKRIKLAAIAAANPPLREQMIGTVRETGDAACWLSDDGMTLVIKRRTPDGILTATYDRTHGAGPFTDADVDYVLSEQFAVTKTMQPGQRNKTRRFVTRLGTLWLHLMTGPPTWWLPRVKREKDGTLMAGWLRLAVAVKFTRRS